jgi:serine/threonine protein kinase
LGLKTCPSAETLTQLLAETLPEAEAGAVRGHLAGCAPCQTRLDQLSDDLELRQLAAAREAGSSPLPSDSGVVRLIEKLRASLPDDSATVGSTFDNSEPSLDFLAPPRQEGDLGCFGSYRVLAKLGHGGMGIVLKAYHPALERTVALKVLRPDRADEAARARFVREAQAAARVTDLHLVPINSVGAAGDGPPYFEMPYIPGPTLLQRIEREKRLDPKEAAGICAQVAEGLAAAHAAGLIHRDIKPSNVLLDASDGWAKIMDFGLVRLTDRPSGLSQEGAIAGTPEYMSPEQVREPLRIDARSDVYSLGVTLYEALTGEVPFRGTLFRVLEQVLHDEPVSPRKRNDRVPRELETICLKALAKEPGRRYQSAQELADDLWRWLVGEPIRARPVGPIGKLGKWCRRKPALAGLAASLLVAVTSGFAGVTWQWLRANQLRLTAETNQARAEQKEAEAAANLQEADQQRQLVQANLDTFFQILGEWVKAATAGDPFLQDKEMLPARKQVLEPALKPYKVLVAQRPNDPKVQAQLARVYYHLAAITEQIDSLEAARDAYEEARAIFERLVQANPSATELQSDLGDTYNRLGNLQINLGKLDAALRFHQQALVVRQKLVRDNPSKDLYRSQLASTYINLGVVHRRTRNSKAALDSYEQSRRIWEQLAKDSPSAPQYQDFLARIYGNVGRVLLDDRQWEASVGASKEAVTRYQRLLQAHPNRLELRSLLGRALTNQGLAYSQLKRVEEALKSHQEAVTHLRVAFDKAPHVTEYREQLTSYYTELARVQRHLGQPAAAAASVVERRKLWPKDAGELYEVARDLALCVPMVGKGKTGLTPAEQAERDKYVDQALETLRQAISAGFKDVEHLKKDKDFDPLRSRDEFKKLLSELEVKPK